jgi:hypothetical protein
MPLAPATRTFAKLGFALAPSALLEAPILIFIRHDRRWPADDFGILVLTRHRLLLQAPASI